MGIEFEGIIPKMETHMEKKKENEMGTGIIEWLFLVPQVYASKSQRCNFKTAGDYIAIYCTSRSLGPCSESRERGVSMSRMCR